MIEIRDEEIRDVECLLLPAGCGFPDDARRVIRCWESTDVAACPGSGKTTVLLAKLKLLADRMPLANGAGICVLSHTNVAVNEIKTKMSTYADKLMGYPNYVGTVQSFIDQFVSLPYLKRKLGKSVQAVDDRTYAIHLYKRICSWKYQDLTGIIKRAFQTGSGQFADEVDFVQNLYLREDGALCIKRRKTPLAGAGRPSAVQFQMAQQDMIEKEQMIRYSDAYQYAKEVIEELSTEYTDLFSDRFKYVFVDEYQDCKDDQREVLAKLFEPGKCCVFHIGDSDQAIYSSEADAIADWQPSGQYLTLGMSNRYGQEIADILSPLRTGKNRIIAVRGEVGYRPVLIVYDEDKISQVLPQFLLQLDLHGITDEKGDYKAIGHIRNRNVSGISIGSYWDKFDGRKNIDNAFLYWGTIDEICELLNAGKMYLAEPLIRKLICRVFHYAGIINAESGKKYTLSTLKKRFDENHFEKYHDFLLNIATLSEYSRQTVSDAFQKFMDTLFEGKPLTGKSVMERLPKHYLDEHGGKFVPETDRNVFVDTIRGRRIQFDSVHGVKGETHDATLYLETVTRGSSDIVRILPYLGVGKTGSSHLFDYSRKLAYVGMSRPKKLLCLAIRKSTYIKSRNAFNEWDLVDLSNEGK